MAEEDFEGPTPPALTSHGLEQFIRKNPIAATMGALVVGLLFGRLARR
jgi:hypothetical protein